MARFVRLVTAAVACAIGASLLAVSTAPAAVRAQPEELPRWTPTRLQEPVWRLWTPASGAFFARTESSLLRSDDAGETWAPVSLPPARYPSLRAVEVDPVTHTRLFVSGDDGLYRSTDDGASWSLVLPTESKIVNVAVSSADPNLVFAAIDVLAGPGTPVPTRIPDYLARSRDGGDTWEMLPTEGQAAACNFGAVQPHPTDPARLLAAGRLCVAESPDQGVTWSTLSEPVGVLRLLGAGGDRWYLLTWTLAPSRGRSAPDYYSGTAFRSDDGARTWQQIGQWGMETKSAVSLAVDPTNPDRVLVAVTANNHESVVSEDGGATWTPVARFTYVPDLSDAAYGVDGKHAYLAAKGGLYRVDLP